MPRLHSAEGHAAVVLLLNPSPSDCYPRADTDAFDCFQSVRSPWLEAVAVVRDHPVTRASVNARRSIRTGKRNPSVVEGSASRLTEQCPQEQKVDVFDLQVQCIALSSWMNGGWVEGGRRPLADLKSRSSSFRKPFWSPLKCCICRQGRVTALLQSPLLPPCRPARPPLSLQVGRSSPRSQLVRALFQPGRTTALVPPTRRPDSWQRTAVFPHARGCDLHIARGKRIPVLVQQQQLVHRRLLRGTSFDLELREHFRFLGSGSQFDWPRVV